MAIETWERYGPLTAFFTEWDDPDNTVITSGVYASLQNILSAEIVKKLGQMSRGKMRLLKGAAADALVLEGRIVGLSQENRVLFVAGGTWYREMGSFLMQSVKEGVDARGREIVEVSGLGQEHLLTKTKHWAPIGDETVMARELDGAAPAPWTTTVGVGAPAGNDSVSLTSYAGVMVGDEIRIEMDSSFWYVGRVTAVLESAPNPNTVTYEPRLPGDASDGNEVEFRRGRLVLDSIAGAAVGQRVVVQLNSGSHETVITEIDLNANAIEIRDGLTGAANSGNDVNIYDYSAPATDDIEQIMEPVEAQGWLVGFQTGGAHGTENGTSHAPYGESVWDLLKASSEQSGEMFRAGILIDGYRPQKRIFWFRTFHSSGMQLWLRSQQSNLDADVENADRGVVMKLEREKSQDIITRVYPVSGDGRIDLEYCTAGALSEAAAAGFSVVVSDDLHAPDYVEYDVGVSEHGVLAATFRFGNIALPTKASLGELQAGADGMLKQAMTMILESQAREYWRAEIRAHRPLYPGQTVVIANYAGVGPQTDDTYNILEVRDYYDGSGLVKTSLLMSKEAKLRITPVTRLGRHLMANEMSARRLTISDRTGGVVLTGGGGGGGGDHGALTGLTDDDHPQYLPVSGVRGMVGNLAMAPGKTVDGVDVDAHAANPAAHHDPVSAGNSAISITGQQISFVPRSGGGIYIEGGAAIRVNPSAGLMIDPVDGLGIRRPPNSGIFVGPGGVWLEPAAISATTVNSNSGSLHTHAVVAAENTIGVGAPTLVKTTATGAVSFDRLGVGTEQTGTAALRVRAKTVNEYSVWIKQVLGQTFPLWRLEDAAGNPLIQVTGAGHLESGTPQFVTGLTGWRISPNGDAEFNDIVARGEFHASIFVADELHASGGTLAILTASKVAKPAAPGDNRLPASPGNTFTLNIQAQHADPGGSYFFVNDVLRMKWIRTNLGGDVMDGRDVFAQVTGVGMLTGRDPANGEPGYYPTTVRWLRGGETTYEIPAGTAVVRWARVGEVFGQYTGGMTLTSDLSLSPYLQIYTIPSHYSASQWQAGTINPVPRVQLGNLLGVLGGVVGKWGLAAGTDLSDGNVKTAQWVTAGDAGVRLQNAGIQQYLGDSQTVDISPAGEMKLGPNVANADTTHFHAFTSGNLRIGPQVAGKPNVLWDTSGNGSLRIRQNTTDIIRLDAGGSSYFAGRMTIGPNGEIVQGSGAMGSAGSWPSGNWGAFTGLRIGRDANGIGRLAAYKNGVTQVGFNTDGQLTAGGGNALMDADGLTLRSHQTGGSGWFDGSALNASLRWRTAGGVVSGYLLSRYDSASGHRSIWMSAGDRRVVVSNDGALEVRAPNVVIGSPSSPGTVTNYGQLTVQGIVEGQNVLSLGWVRASSYVSSLGIGLGPQLLGVNPGAGVVQVSGQGSHPSAPLSGTVKLYVIETATGGGGNNYTLYMRKPSGAVVAIATV